MLHNSDSELGNVAVARPSVDYEPERAAGVSMDELPRGAVVEVVTGHTTSRVENRGDGKALISGHPTYCPTPVLVDLHGSVGSPAMLKIWFIGPGLKMEFSHPKFGVIRTSRVRSVCELKSEVPS
jgi:hypothetical protein